jgi:hypothetical protein
MFPPENGENPSASQRWPGRKPPSLLPDLGIFDESLKFSWKIL